MSDQRVRLGDEELAFLRGGGPRALARIATVDERGRPHVVPGGWAWDDDAGELVLGGRDVPTTRRARHVRANGHVAVTIDGVDTAGGWAPWALLLRCRARVDEARGEIRLRPDRVTSWGLGSVLTRRGPVA